MTGLAVVAIATVIFAGTPGPAVLGCLVSGTVFGLGRTIPFILGIVIGDVLYLIVSLVGISAIVSRFSGALYIGSIIGGLYLVYSGAETIFHRYSSTSDSFDEIPSKSPHIKEGLLLTAGNPKVLLFYFAISPNWLPAGKPSFISSLTIIMLMASILVIVNWSYALLGRLIGKSLVRSMKSRDIQTAGGLMIALVGIYVCIFSIYQLKLLQAI